MKKLLVLLLLLSAMAGAQVSSHTAFRIRFGSALPATCSPNTGDVFFKTSATIGSYQCLVANTWTAMGGGGAVAGADTQVIFNDAGAYAGNANFTFNKTTGVLSLLGGSGSPSIVCGSGVATTPCSLEGDSGDAVTNAEPAYLKLGTSPANTRFNYFYPSSAAGRFCFSASVPAADCTTTLADYAAQISDSQTQLGVYYVDTGAANAYVITPNPAIGAYATGQRFCFKPVNANTTASTIAISGLATKNIFKYQSVALAANDILAASIVCVVYDGTQFEMQSLPGVQTAVSSLTAAQGADTIANGNNVQIWNWAQTTNSQSTMTFGETSAATAGTLTNALANQTVLLVQTAGASTATPLDVKQGTLTGVTAFPLMQLRGGWSNASLTGIGLIMNITDTNSAAASLLMDLRVGNADKFTVVKTGRFGTYAGIATAGIGSTTVYGATSQKAETTTADANVLTYTPPAVAGTYRVEVAISVASATSGVISYTVSWTDSNGNAQSNIAGPLFQYGTAAPNTTFTTSAAGNYSGFMDIDVNNAAASIVVKWVGGGTTSAKMSATVEQVQ